MKAIWFRILCLNLRICMSLLVVIAYRITATNRSEYETKAIEKAVDELNKDQMAQFKDDLDFSGN